MPLDDRLLHVIRRQLKFCCHAAAQEGFQNDPVAILGVRETLNGLCDVMSLLDVPDAPLSVPVDVTGGLTLRIVDDEVA